MIVRVSGKPFKETEFQTFLEFYDEWTMEKIVDDVTTFHVENWQWFPDRVEATVKTLADYEGLKGFAARQKLRVMTKQTWELQQKKKYLYTGHLKPITAKLSVEKLNLFVGRYQKEEKIEGQLRITRVLTVLPGNMGTLVQAEADEDAMKRWKDLDFSIRIGSSGLVKFIPKKKNDETTLGASVEGSLSKIEQLEAQIKAEKDFIAQARAKLEIHSAMEGVEAMEVGETPKNPTGEEGNLVNQPEPSTSGIPRAEDKLLSPPATEGRGESRTSDHLTSVPKPNGQGQREQPPSGGEPIAGTSSSEDPTHPK